MQNNADFVLALLAVNVAINVLTSDDNYNTALHLAAIYEKNQVIVTLLTAGANHKLRNQQGLKPTEAARVNGKFATAALIAQEIEAIKQRKAEQILSLIKKQEELILRQSVKLQQLSNELRIIDWKVHLHSPRRPILIEGHTASPSPIGAPNRPSPNPTPEVLPDVIDADDLNYELTPINPKRRSSW